MCNFHYNYIKKKYGDRAKLLFTDTDSLIYEIEAEDVYNDFWNNKDMFDSSGYPENLPYHCNANKKVIGKFKDEACGVPITEFIGLKSKMYSYIKSNEKCGKTTKGINPIQAGLFWNHIGWGGAHCAPPLFLLYLLSNYH